MERKHGIFVAAIIAAAILQGCTQKAGPPAVARRTAQADPSRAIVEAQQDFDRVYALNNSEVVESRIYARSQDPRNSSSPVANNADARRQRIEARQRIAAAQLALDMAKGEDGQNRALAQCDVNASPGTGSCIAGAAAP